MFSQDGWILASFSFCVFMGVEFVSVHNNAEKELGQYGAILTSSLVNNACIKQKLRSEKQWPGAIRLAVKFERPDNFNLSIQKMFPLILIA